MRTAASPKLVGDFIFGQTRGGVLNLLYGHPSEEFYVRQIARLAGLSVGIVQRELESLNQVGLVTRSKRGNQVFYKANQESPVYVELAGLISKTLGVFQLLRSSLAPLEERIAWAFVYGSVARQKETAESDVDLMVVGNVTLEEVLACLAAVEAKIGRLVNPTLYPVAEFRDKIVHKNHFIGSVIRNAKVSLIGDGDEFRKVG